MKIPAAKRISWADRGRSLLQIVGMFACLLGIASVQGTAAALPLPPGDEAWDTRFHRGLGDVRLLYELADGSVIAVGNVMAPGQEMPWPSPGIIRWTQDADWQPFAGGLGSTPSSRCAAAEFRGELHLASWGLNSANGQPVAISSDGGTVAGTTSAEGSRSPRRRSSSTRTGCSLADLSRARAT